MRKELRAIRLVKTVVHRPSDEIAVGIPDRLHQQRRPSDIRARIGQRNGVGQHIARVMGKRGQVRHKQDWSAREARHAIRAAT